MCRWFAYIAPEEECLLEDVLVTPAHALSKQVHEHYLPKLLSHDPAVHAEKTSEAEISTRNRLFNVDGFGMAWYTSTASSFANTQSPSNENLTPSPALYKTIQTPLHDWNFRSICSNTSTTCLFAHIRAATSTAITPTNNHPFVFGRHTFMHNGFVSGFSRIARQLYGLLSQEAFEGVSGATDSECLAALYVTILTKGDGKVGWGKRYSTGEMLKALESTVNTVIDLQTKALGNSAEPSSLNIAVTDGEQLVAMRYRNHPTEQPPSLYWSKTAGVTLNRKYPDHPNGENGDEEGNEGAWGHSGGGLKEERHGVHVIVASEPSTYRNRDWNLVEKNHAVLVERDGVARIEEVRCGGF